MKKKIIIILGIIFIVVTLLFIFQNVSNNENNKDENNDIESIIKYDQNVIEEIKNEINATGNTNIYQVEQEYDGRQIIQVRPNIQFDTAFAGILKGSKPQENEIEDLLNNRPSESGTWVSENSRDKFLNLLKENGIESYTINEKGYLTKQQENSNNIQKLDNAIQSNKLYIIDINGISYIRDDISGEVVEYPFEQMDPYQAVDVYENENNIIIEVTTNKNNKLSNEEILDLAIQNIQ